MTGPRTLLGAWHIQAKKRLGQHFLNNSAVAENVVRTASVESEDLVLEIGAGLGALTIPLARAARTVLAVEKDAELIRLLTAELLAAGVTNVRLMGTDIFAVDLPAIARSERRPLHIFGNLPYNISSQILVRLAAVRTDLARAVLMFQKELAERICAPPGGKDYGRLSVLMQYCSRIRTLAEVRAADFFPRPKVDSLVLEFSFITAPSVPAADEPYFNRVVQAAFGQRRKTLKNALTGSFLNLAESDVRGALASVGIDPARRAETLAVAEFVELSNRLYVRTKA